MKGRIVIEPVEDLEGFHECERLQKEVWGFDDISVVPDHVLLTVVKGGGLLLGAFAVEGGGREMVGFALSFFGRAEDGTLKHCSLMAAVKDGWRDKGLGYRLKLAQREYVLRQGVGLITWTFDPLESRNAHFNLNKLGCVVARYHVNYYGSLRDERNKGLPTDRFLCEWHLKSPRVERRIAQGFPGFPKGLVRELPCALRAEGKEPGPVELELKEERVLVEIPPDFQALRRESMELALRWRLAAREALSHYMGQGYLATGLVREGNRSFLLLERKTLEEVLSSP
jgi:predicted GNAT superfamily acetyltransferase